MDNGNTDESGCFVVSRHGISLKEHTRSEEIRKRAKVTKWRLSWYWHTRRRDTEDITRMVLDNDITGKRQEVDGSWKASRDSPIKERYENIIIMTKTTK